MSSTFSIIDDPWIPLLKEDGQVDILSLRDCLLGCRHYYGLACSVDTQNIAVLRFLEAMCYQIAICDPESDYVPVPFDNPEDALTTWKDIWLQGQFPKDAVNAYLDSVKDAFWLTSAEKPFLQARIADRGTEFEAKKLLSEISESNNKKRLFSLREGEKKNCISLSEAVPCLLALNGFDDSAIKPKDTGDGAAGVGYLAKLGLLFAQGKNLFETLMLNLTLLRDGTELWGDDKPYWEEDSIVRERHQIPVPNSPSRLWSLPSRRILLIQNKDHVTGYHDLSGDFFPVENAFAEQHTLWKVSKTKKNAPPVFAPKLRSPDRSMWRDFSSLTGEKLVDDGKEKQEHRPGLVSWISTLTSYDCLPPEYPITFFSPCIQFNDKKSSITDVTTNTLQMQTSVLSEAGEFWRKLILSEIESLGLAASYTGYLYSDIEEACGQSGDRLKAARSKGRSDFYAAVNSPFSAWIASLDSSNSDGKDEYSRRKKEQWRNTVQAISSNLADETGRNVPLRALISREVCEKDKTPRKILSVPEAQSKYRALIRKLYGNGTVDRKAKASGRKQGDPTNE